MSFPAGWTQEPRNYIPNYEWHREVEPTAAALTYALMTLPAATIIKYTNSDSWSDTQVTHIEYRSDQQEAVLS